MKNGNTLYVGLDVHKDSIAVAYAATEGATQAERPAQPGRSSLLFDGSRLVPVWRPVSGGLRDCVSDALKLIRDPL